jgi:ATP-dependent RNA helicase DDX51/DBP6
MAKDIKAKKHGESTVKESSTPSRRKDASASTPPIDTTPKPKKRKRETKSDIPDELAGNHEAKNPSNESPTNSTKNRNHETQPAAKGTVPTSGKNKKKDRLDVSEASGPSFESDESSSDSKNREGDNKNSKKRKNDAVGKVEPEADQASEDHPAKTRKHKHGESSRSHRDEDESHATKHSKILKKFEKSTKTKKPVSEDAGKEKEDILAGETGNAVVAHGLEPLPQPEPVADAGEKPTYSTMPNWITNPVTKSPYQRDDGSPIEFNSLQLDKGVISKLNKHGYKEATPVQATVIPLLIDNAHRHIGDVCVSASTGSGKTLSYVLPMDQSLRRESEPRLRGLIVVPTRELVKQVREAFEACGSNLRIGTAIGHVALKDEQQKLIRWDSVYSPGRYEEDQHKTMSTDDWASFDLLKYRDEVERTGELLPRYVQAPRPNIDVLISTPGRLVDHIRQTEGFTLRHLQWLVVDEADRLLNESFQEWVSVLMGALDKEKTANVGGPVMANIGRPLQSAYPRKVILSATLTNDITKLNSLRLDNPKLVAIGSRDLEPDAEGNHETEQFVLPPKLVEHFAPVGDGSEKPVHLMKLLLHEINKSSWGSIATPAYASEIFTKSTKDDSTDEETSLDSDDTSSSGDDTSSSGTSESESDSSSESESGSDTTSEASSESDTDTSSDSDTDTSVDDDSSIKELHAIETGVKSVLIFTKSTESAARLSHLLGLMNPALKEKMGTIVKSSNSSSSRKTLQDYRAGRINIIVATDRASRGIDLVGLDVVINYDVPSSLTTYVHRVGRTARAGRSGHAWTLVEHREGLWFQKVIVKSDNVVRSAKVMKYGKSEKNTKVMIAEYTVALQGLEKATKG